MGNWNSSQSIEIPIQIKVPKYTVDGSILITHSFSSSIDYANSNVNDVLNKAVQYINHKLYPTKYRLWMIEDRMEDKLKACWRTFVNGMTKEIKDEYESIATMEDGHVFQDKYRDKIFESVCLSTFNKEELVEKGFEFTFGVDPIKQNIHSNKITCAHLISSQNKQNALNCPIYRVMIKDYLWNEENLNHLFEHTHFEDDNRKTECRYKQNCAFYQKMIGGEYGLKERCHCKLYRHPPRYDRITLKKEVHPFTYINIKKEEQKMNMLTIYDPRDECKETGDEKRSKYIVNKLIEEVVRNGYEEDLCLDKERDLKNNDHTLMNIVKEKMKHPKHKRLGCPLNECHVLALLLYTGCHCNHDLCLSQRNGDYQKWKIFDWCLNGAIHRLSTYERGSFRVYSGVCGVKLDRKQISLGFLPTFTSTTWKKEVAQMFVGSEGVILVFDDALRCHWPCCDVSWISHFDEYEILFSRLPPNTLGDYYHGLECKIIDDDTNGIQTATVKLKKMQNQTYQKQFRSAWRKVR
eukprot:234370_1